MDKFGKAPVLLGDFDFSLPEVMYYLYLPVVMEAPKFHTDIRTPPALECTRPLIQQALATTHRKYRYAYISARKGWATQDAPLNRPGWHCDGFGTDDLNFLWWRGPGTRFATGDLAKLLGEEISTDHKVSMEQFEYLMRPNTRLLDSGLLKIDTPPQCMLYGVDPYVVHSTPIIRPPGCMRQYVKVSLSDQRYDLYNNSHNYLFDYDWEMKDREWVRNDTSTAQRDYS